MPVYQSAGVYVVEKDLSQVVPTTSTSTGAIVLYAKRGPINTPKLVTNTQEFINNFGTPHPTNGYGAYASLAFLERSSQLYVVRVVEGAYAYSGAKVAATVASQHPTVTTTTGITGGQSPSGFTFASEAFFAYPIGPGVYGDNYKIGITSDNLIAPSFYLFNKPTILSAVAGGSGGTLAAGDYTYQVTAVDALGNETSANTATAVMGLTAGQVVTVTLTAAITGAVSYKVYRAKTSAPAIASRYVGSITTGLVFTDDGSNAGSGTQTPPASGTLAAATYYYKVTAVNSKGQETDSNAGLPYVVAALGDRPIIHVPRIEGASYYKVYGRPAVIGGTYTYLTTLNQPSSGNAVLIDDGSIAGTAATIPSANYDAVPEFKLALYDTDQSTTVPIEEYTVTLIEKLDGFGQQMEIETRINTFSQTMRVVKNTAYTDGAYGLLSVAPTSMAGGADGDAYSSVSAGAFVAGWDQFIDPEVITVRILIEGGTQQSAVQIKMNSVAQSRKDCFAILDTPTAYQETTQAIVYRRDVLNLNSNRAAIYTPDLKINDPYNDLVIYVPPSGHVAAVFAFTDFSSQVWYAPAGLNRGVLNVLGVRYKYNQAQRDLLAPVQINYVRNFPGLGLAVWEQITLQSKTSALSFINVRRMLDIIEVSVSQALLFSNQEPNDDFLKRQIVVLISQFLEVIKNGRGIADYAVISDSSNNPPQVANQGQLNVDVYLQPILPARIIQLQMIITKQGVSFQELIAQGGNV